MAGTRIASLDDFEMRVAGINHLIWLLSFTIRGRTGCGWCATRVAVAA